VVWRLLAHFLRTLPCRSPKLLKEIVLLPRSFWRTVELDVSTRKYRTPRVYEQTVSLAGRSLRQIFVQDLGHDELTILVTNQRHTPAKALLTRYAQRTLIGASPGSRRNEGERRSIAVMKFLKVCADAIKPEELQASKNVIACHPMTKRTRPAAKAAPYQRRSIFLRVQRMLETRILNFARNPESSGFRMARIVVVRPKKQSIGRMAEER
jgi:hypothetical protein